MLPAVMPLIIEAGKTSLSNANESTVPYRMLPFVIGVGGVGAPTLLTMEMRFEYIKYLYTISSPSSVKVMQSINQRMPYHFYFS